MLNHTHKVVHLTSAHNRNDTRIFLKECCSLVKKFSVAMVVADGKGFETFQGVEIHDAGKLSGRLNRIFKTTQNVYKKAVELDADLYHLHDPELIPIGLKLKRRGKRVVFDAHEDLPNQILGKPYLNWFSAHVISFIIKHYEKWACAKFDGIISATPVIDQKFAKINSLCANINNFPIIGELGEDKNWAAIDNSICFVGDISLIRGVIPLVKSLDITHSKTKLSFAGYFSDTELKNQVSSMPGWKMVSDHGYLNRDAVKTLMSKSFAGVVTFLPVPNHIESQPNKMFEYMSAGLPVIASHFPLWKEIIEGNNCGLCVNPESPEELAQAIDSLWTDKDKAKSMGTNGKTAVQTKYNWNVEEKKLFEFYDKVLSK